MITLNRQGEHSRCFRLSRPKFDAVTEIELGDLDGGYRPIDVSAQADALYIVSCNLFIALILVVIYDENGVVIKSIPANHLEQAASFILEWNGMTMAFSGDTIPNKWWIENTQGIDFAIHECVVTPDLAVKKWGFSPEELMIARHTQRVLAGAGQVQTVQ